MSRRPANDLHLEHETERAFAATLARHKTNLRLERERHARRLSALCPGTAVEDPDFPGCTWDSAPYPAPIAP